MDTHAEHLLRKKSRLKKLAKRSYSDKSGSLARQVVKVKIARGYAGARKAEVKVRVSV